MRKAVFQWGVPDEIKGLRPIVWRVFLNYLPTQTSKWEEHIIESKKVYDAWKQELIIQPDLKNNETL